MRIEFSKYNLKIHSKNDQLLIFDEVRKKNVILTPEEWVRQHFIHFFIQDLSYPKGKIAIEKEFTLNGLKKRFDLLVFDKDTQPFLLLECKAQSEVLSEKVLQQCLNYNIKLAVPYLAISNGDYTHAWQITAKKIIELDRFPVYHD